MRSLYARVRKSKKVLHYNRCEYCVCVCVCVCVCYQIIWNNQIIGNKICRKVFTFLSCRFALTIYAHAIHYYIYTVVFVFLPLCHIHTPYAERKTATKVCKLS